MKANADPQLAVTLQGHYAGAVTRLAAFAIDQAVATSAFALGSAIVSWVLHLVTGGELTWNPSPWITGLLFFFWLFLYYAYPWSVRCLAQSTKSVKVLRLLCSLPSSYHCRPSSPPPRTCATANTTPRSSSDSRGTENPGSIECSYDP